MSKYNLTFLVDSNPDSGSSNLRENGSVFDVPMNPPLIIPRNAHNIYLEVKNATVWWSVPNVSELIGNNMFKLRYQGITVQFPIPTGLYSYSDLSVQLQVLISNYSNGAIPEDVIELVALIAENKIAIKINYADVDIDFTIADSVRTLIGFEAQIISVGVAATVPVNIVAENIAEFNSINYFLISAPSLVSRGLNFNSVYKSIIARVPINVSPNSQIQYDPRQTYRIPANELAGCDYSNLTFRLTDDKGLPVDTRTEYWSCLFIIHYEVN
jgi:hypothetical protein